MTVGESGKIIGLVGGTLTIAIPAFLWAVVLRPWRPRSRLACACRFALWPLVVLSFNLGVPLALQLLGLHATYGKSLGESLVFVFKASLVGGVFFFAIGWRWGRTFSKQEVQETTAVKEGS